MFSIKKPVGLKCDNEPGDVFVVQVLLNKFIVPGCLPLLAPLLADGQCGNKTVEAIYAFQSGILGWKKPDLRIDPGGQTLAALNGPLKWANKPAGNGGVIDLPKPSAPADVTWGDPVVITAIDLHEQLRWKISWGKVVYLISVQSMVNNVLKAAGNSPIGRLYIVSHGYYDGSGNGFLDAVFMRHDSITVENFKTWEPELLRLRPHFHKLGDVVLLACFVGQNRPLLRKIAATFQVPVYGGTLENDDVVGQYGVWMRCSPDGKIERHSPHPAPTTKPIDIDLVFWSKLF